MSANQIKIIAKIEILNLDEHGYGPDGMHTRREWRKECLDNLLAGRGQFQEWQDKWKDKIVNSQTIKLGYKVYYEDGTSTNYGGEGVLGLDFIGQHFKSAINLEDFDIYANLYFCHAKFDLSLQFSNAKVFKDVDFKCAMLRDVRFGKTEFFGRAVFSEAMFLGIILFDNTTFFGNANFIDSILEESSNFISADFRSGASFNGAKFLGTVYFNNALFGGRVSFRQTEFNFTRGGLGTGAYFSDSKFERAVDFNRAFFVSDAYFDKAKFNSVSNFREAAFHKKANFENASFSNVGHFEGANFLRFFPDFRGCKIDSTHLEFSDDNSFTKEDYDEEGIKNIGFLKRLADEHGQTDQALNFNAMELRAKRNLEFRNLRPAKQKDAKYLLKSISWRIFVCVSAVFKGKFWFCIFTYLYELFSDFGRSFTRPLFLLIFLNIITIVICLFVASQHLHSNQSVFSSLTEEIQLDNNNKITLTAFRAATEYSLYKTGNFFDFSDADKRTEIVNQRLFGSAIEPKAMRVYGFLKRLFSAILIFLIGLGVRNKYRVS